MQGHTVRSRNAHAFFSAFLIATKPWQHSFFRFLELFVVQGFLVLSDNNSVYGAIKATARN